MGREYQPEGRVGGWNETDDAESPTPAPPPAPGGSESAGARARNRPLDEESARVTAHSTDGGGERGAWGVREWARWAWRQLTSMRVALLLLMLLAVAALPGAFLPQRPQNPAGVARYYVDHPGAAPWLERFHLFDVYASPWFAAIYLLLFISLVGCIVPRAIDHIHALRRPPPKAPRRFTRFPDRAAFSSSAPLEDAVAAARTGLRGYRVREERVGGVVSLSGERGYLREAGNIVFHLSLVGLLVSMAYGTLVHYRGQILLVEGDTFANSRLAYDSFDAGAWFSEDSLGAFRLRVDAFEATYLPSGQASDFRADVTVTQGDGPERSGSIKVNEPLRVGGANVYLMGNGFAPLIEVRDPEGKLAFSGNVPFIPLTNTSFESRGVVKVADTTGETQIGLNGFFLPDAVIEPDIDLYASDGPNPDDPALVLETWSGNLGLDLGVPQNVYQLDTSRMTQSMEEIADPMGSGEMIEVPARVVVRPGETVDLPDGLGTVTFVDLPRFVGLDLRYDPTLGWVLGFALAAIAGLGASLFLPRRRVFVRLGVDGRAGEAAGAARTLVTAAAMARGDDPGLARELERVLGPVRELDSPTP